KQKVGTSAFADAVIERLGQSPSTLPKAVYNKDTPPPAVPTAVRHAPANKKLVGVDVFVHSTEAPDDVAAKLAPGNSDDIELA
ncbi:hypothetical protein, partial [Tritonibacter sp. SIMBA_163]|uniref:hypothetical protein n=1 Tax=Tritonibacter sp. SIMBA_163 TaxID=3080868 RepID=UPI003980DF8E